jgi:hypothetical protein
LSRAVLIMLVTGLAAINADRCVQPARRRALWRPDQHDGGDRD